MKQVIIKNKIPLLIFFISLIFYSFFLSPSLDDWDSVQFALGVEEYNLEKHQPHPPGYPVYIFLGKIFNFFCGNVVLALTLMSSFFGALALVFFYLLIAEMFNKKIALLSTSLFTVTPLFWLNSLKAMTDIPALSFTLAAILCIYRYIKHQETNYLYAGAIIGGISIGVRFHMLFILLPLLMYTLITYNNKRIQSTLLFLLGILLWVIPMILNQGINRILNTSKAQFIWRLNNPNISVFNTPITFDYLYARLIDFIYFFFSGYGIDLKQMSFSSYLLLTLIIILPIIFMWKVSKKGIKDQRLHFVFIAILPYLLMIFITLPPHNPRYLLALFPILSTIFVLALNKFKTYGKFIYALLFSLIAFNSFPLALDLHENYAPPIQMQKYIESHYDAENTIVIITGRSEKHFSFYTLGSTTFNSGSLPSLKEVEELLKKGKTVLITGRTQKYKPLLLKPVALFSRNTRIHVKHSETILYEIAE